MSKPVSKKRLNSSSPPNIVDRIAARILGFLTDILDLIFTPLQTLLGVKGMAYFFILPNLLIFGIFILMPMLINFQYAFTGGANLFLEDRRYVGTENIEQLFDCENFLEASTCTEDLFIRAVGNTAWFVVIQVVFMILISLITAVVLNQNIRARGFFRSVFFYPVLLSPIVVALLWRWILQSNGLFNAILVNLGFDRIDMLTYPGWAQFWVIFISVWSLMGFYTLILLAGLQSIPHDLYEAAAMDGANKWRSFWSITMPLLMPSMLVVVVLATIRAVQTFDVVWAFTNGGPGTATTYIVQYIYMNGFASATKRYGIAAAASLVMAAFLIVFTLIQIGLRRNDDTA